MQWPVVKREGAWSIVAGLFIGAGLLHPWVWPATIVGLVVFFVLLSRTAQASRAFWLGWMVGGIKSAIVLQWFYAAYPLDWVQVPPGLWQLGLITLYVVPAAVTLGLGTAAFSYIYVRFGEQMRGWWRWVLIPLAWVGGELLGAAVFSIYTLGPGSSIQTYFSFGFIGYAFASHSWLLQIAHLGGVYVLSVSVVVSSLALETLMRRKTHVLIMIVAVVVVGTSFLKPLVNYEIKGLTVGVLEMDWPKLREDVSPRLIDEIKTSAARHGLEALSAEPVNHIVMPEDVRLTLYQGGLEGTLAYLTSLFDSGVVVIDSSRVESSGTFARAFLYDTGTQEAHTFDKQYLVPQGEYVPYVYSTLLSLLPLPPAATEALAWIRYQPGRPQTIVPLSSNHPAVLFCFESVQPTGVRAAVGDRTPPFVAHLVSHAWFSGEPRTLWHQLDAMLKVQSVWSGLPIVQAANNTDAKLYLPTGAIISPNFIAEGATWRAGLFKL